MLGRKKKHRKYLHYMPIYAKNIVTFFAETRKKHIHLENWRSVAQKRP